MIFIVSQHFSLARIVTFCSFFFHHEVKIFTLLDALFNSYIKVALFIGRYILSDSVFVIAELAGFNLDF